MFTFTGCSGFHYDDWKGAFYPEEISKDVWLPYYAEHFSTVEINNSFYNLPAREKLEKWHEQTPGNFRFTMKGSRYITGMKKLVNDEDVHDGIKKLLLCRGGAQRQTGLYSLATAAQSTSG